jgi:hypothetical protein
MSARLFAIATGLSMLAGASVVTATTASAECRGFVQAHAEGTFKTATELLSRARWRSEVGERYGAAFGFWHKAVEKSTRCFKSDPGNTWTCTARGKPCD